ncbi:MAG: PAS domain S-box protein [Spirochaetes bacterium]|nr:PAS domain S-box protein [Spirochaetota bacterium]
MPDAGQNRYQKLFLDNPVAIFEQDFREVKKTIDKLKKQGITDFVSYFDANPDLVEELLKTVTITDANSAALKLYGAPSREVFFTSIDQFFTKETAQTFKTELIAIAEGKYDFRAALINRTFDNKLLNIYIAINFPENPEDYRNIPVSIVDISRQKKVEYILNEAQRIAHIGSWEFDLQTHTSYWSDEVYRIYGLAKNEYNNTYTSFLQHIHPEDRELVDRTYNESVQTGNIYSVTHRILLKDGTVKYVHEHGKTFYDSENKPIRTIGTTFDITDRITARKELEENEERFHSIVQNSPAGIVVTDESYVIRYVNNRFCKITGFDRDELINRDFRELLFKAIDRKTSQDILYRFKQRIKGKHISQSPDYSFKRKNGKRVWIQLNGSTYKDSKGITFSVSQVLDITERKQREKEIRRLSSIIEQSPLSVFITDLNGNIEYVNPQFTKQTGYTFLEVKKKNPRIFRSGEHSQELYRNLWDTIEAGKTWFGEFHNKKKNGDLFWEKTVIGPIFDEKGRITNYVCIKEDITEQRILKQRLNQSQKLEILGQLAGGIAHDFNNILTIINGYSTLLLDTLDKNDPLREDIEQIKIAGERATALTRQLLVFSKKQITNVRVINLNTVLKNTVKMLKRLIGENINLKLSLADNLLNIRADTSHIDQIIMNLAVNARDAIPHDGTLTIITSNRAINRDFVVNRPEMVPGEYVELTVKDDGAGMEDNIREKIFEPFFTTKGKELGTGLGLSTVYGIVKQNDGYIEVESKPGEGTSFTILLPAVYETTETYSRRRKTKGTVKGAKTVLLAEDEEAVRNLTEQVLKNAGYVVIVAEDGERALNICNSYSGTIHLLLTDVIMPKINGGKLACEISKNKPDIKILFMSGYTADTIDKHNTPGKEILLLQKPFEPEELLKAVEKALE